MPSPCKDCGIALIGPPRTTAIQEDGVVQGIGQQFLELTKYRKMGKSDYGKGLPQPPLELPWDEKKPLIPLPPPAGIPLGKFPVRQAVDERRSLREYAETPLTLEELSFLLWCTQGVQEIVPGSRTTRTVPSAGSRHALETLVCVNNVEGLTPGIYRFVASKHALIEENLAETIRDRLTEACLGQTFVKMSGATFIWVAVVYRMNYRYGERGYRYLYLDAGHVCQNLYLAAEAIDCGACGIAAFQDDEVNRVLRLDGESQFAIYLGAVGKKP
jgi:SagB-type dehydrogenase family enzyme